ncbi:MAG: biotin-dependent carboxyltransferase [Acidobacteria bacterium]|nr:biotin-dependent carboxyltransferase [Acidobacteriota bacterium]
MSLGVLRPGLLDLVQDRGRFGFQDRGVGPAGPADPLSHALANLLVANPPDAAVLEITLRGPALRFETDVVAAFTGAPFPLAVAGKRVHPFRPLFLRAGATLEIGETDQGLRGYLAVAGGVEVPPVLGSRATDLRGTFGGQEGRALREGDRLPLGAPREEIARLLGSAMGKSEPFLACGWRLPWSGPLPGQDQDPTLALIPGPQWPDLAPPSRRALLEEGFRVGPASDRMGLRLQGPRLDLTGRTELLSAPVVTGTLQLPPDGQPILLMADRQTTGGYPRLGEVATVDLPRAAQARPGSPLRFTLVEAGEARRRLKEQGRGLAFLRGLLLREFANGGMMGPCGWT